MHASILCFLGDGDDLYQVAILVDQLKHDDVQQRVNAFSNLERIGKFFTACLFLFIFYFFDFLSNYVDC